MVRVLRVRVHTVEVAAVVPSNEVTVETYPLIDEKKGHYPFAFEVKNAYVAPGTIARLLMEIDGITDVRTRRLFSGSSEIHVEFKYLSRDYIVWEPYGDNSRYWIGPKNPEESAGDISNIEDVFKRYRPPFHREVIGDILSFRLFKRLAGRG